MSFWDRFVRALYFGLAADAATGRGAALRDLDLALTGGHLPLTGLCETSLLLLLALLPASSPHRAAVLARALNLGLDLRPDNARMLRDAAPPRLAELVELARAPVPQLRNLVITSLWTPGELGVVESVSLYLGRIWLGDPNSLPVRTIARSLIAQAIRYYAPIPVGTYDFLGWLFRWVRRETQAADTPFPVVFPPGPRQPWFTCLEAYEQKFITTCLLSLVEPAVDVLYLHFYAGLSVGQITQALRLLRPRGATDAVIRRLEESWTLVLSCTGT